MFEKSYTFLQQLKKNNNRDWYHAHKDLYNEAKEEFELVTDILLRKTSAIDHSLSGLSPKDCIFRIFRDVRFSHDKSPYKTNFGAFLAPGGRKLFHAGYYLHIEPGASLIASGIYMPPSNILKAVREDIYHHYEEYLEILGQPEVRTLYGEVSGDKLKTAPKGFDKDFAGIAHLKYKSFSLMVSVTDAALKKDGSLEMITDHFRIAAPFVKFLNEAVKKA